MNSNLMTQYIKFVADRLVVNLGYQSIYNVSNPFSFMEHISLESKNNFFENRTSEYQKASTKTETNDMFNESDNF
jgi:ribonucleotide reductase beta subunit family protein with ferritin-like domain